MQCIQCASHSSDMKRETKLCRISFRTGRWKKLSQKIILFVHLTHFILFTFQNVIKWKIQLKINTNSCACPVSPEKESQKGFKHEKKHFLSQRMWQFMFPYLKQAFRTNFDTSVWTVKIRNVCFLLGSFFLFEKKMCLDLS